MPTARHGLASEVVDNRWYLIDGVARAGAMTFISLTDLVEIFAPDLRGEEIEPRRPLPLRAETVLCR